MADSKKRTMFKATLISSVFLILIVEFYIVFRARKKCEIKAKRHKLLIVLIDGMRFDYVSRDPELQWFPKMMSGGVHPVYVNPIFPSSSLPNWYSIATGLYAEKHGITLNYMFDPVYNEFFKMLDWPNTIHSHWWNQSVPLWVTAEQSGLKTSVYFWGGCDVTIKGQLPSRCLAHHKFSDSKTENSVIESKLDTIVGDFKNDKFDLSMLYYSQVDQSGHFYGPDSNQTYQAVKDIDGLLNKFLTRINQEKLQEVVNLYVVSDHGMSKPFNLLYLEQLINMKDAKYVVGLGTLMMIVPQDKQAEDRIYKDFKRNAKDSVKIYKKAEIPVELHIKNSSRTLDLLVIAKPGHLVTVPKIDGKTYPGNGHLSLTPGLPRGRVGFHGYFVKESKEMRAIMFAIGPAFKKGFKARPMKQVDHYQIFCHILNLKCNQHDGNWKACYFDVKDLNKLVK